MHFDYKSFLKQFIIIAFPVALQNLLTTTGSMIDTMMVGSLGELNVAALGLCSQFSTLMISGYWGFVGGGMLFFSQYWGSQEEDALERSYGMTWICMMTVATIFCIMAVGFPSLVMKMYTDKTSIQDIGVQYLHIVGWAYLMQVFSMVISTMLRATERVKIPLIASIASVLSNIFFNWVLIYGRFGIAPMGIKGAAIATVLAAFINLSVVLVLAKTTGFYYIFKVNKHFKWTASWIGVYFKKCLPIIINEVFLGIGNMIINVTLGRQDEYVIAAVAVFRTIEGMIIAFFQGFSSASSVMVGSKVGAGELDLAYERAKRIVYLCSLGIALFCGVLLAVHTPLLHAMSLQGDSFKAGTTLLEIFSIAVIIRMGNWIHNDTFRASGDSIYGTVLEIIFMYGLQLPCVLISAFVLHLPYWIIFICCYIDEPIRYVMMQHHLYSGRFIKPVTKLGIENLSSFRKKHEKIKKTVV